ncbi:hypothetical protein ANCCAN_19151 [Ancylostoma caninum]|uniref:Uncharacterized protein n=1 Tax=Ancylostoma caninum TaxID=29170 RepID=A0A368FSE1_ANCCA|nr:hypothetical protein ANCCAN_19151 [Ancylostoma caninum]
MFSKRTSGGGEWTPSNIKKCWERICSLFGSTTDDLRAVILDVWEQTDDNAIQNLVKSMPRKTFEVIRNDGGPIDY